jgi:hypothetical protein
MKKRTMPMLRTMSPMSWEERILAAIMEQMPIGEYLERKEGGDFYGI